MDVLLDKIIKRAHQATPFVFYLQSEIRSIEDVEEQEEFSRALTFCVEGEKV